MSKGDIYHCLVVLNSRALQWRTERVQYVVGTESPNALLDLENNFASVFLPRRSFPFMREKFNDKESSSILNETSAVEFLKTLLVWIHHYNNVNVDNVNNVTIATPSG